MRHATINGHPTWPQSSQHVISRSAILILSGILIGTTVAQSELTGLSLCRSCAGVVGLISFFALDLVARRRETRGIHKRLAIAHSTLAKRLRRHVASQTLERHRPFVSVEASYLPVTTGRK